MLTLEGMKRALKFTLVWILIAIGAINAYQYGPVDGSIIRLAGWITVFGSAGIAITWRV